MQANYIAPPSMHEDFSTKLAVDINVAKMVCESLEHPDQELVDEAFKVELEAVHKELLEIFKKNKVPKSFYPTLKGDIETDTKELYRVLYLQIARNPKGYKLEQYNKLRKKLDNELQWRDKHNIDPRVKWTIEHAALIESANEAVAKARTSKKALTFSYGKNKDKSKKVDESVTGTPDNTKPKRTV
jgi:hypothetical protein